MSCKEDRELSEKTVKLRDDIYNKSFNMLRISRFDWDDQTKEDMHYHIDAIVTLKNGKEFSLQEKGLRHKFSKYNTLTIEYYQNRFTQEQGEFFNCKAKCYFSGYLNESETAFDKWIFIDYTIFKSFILSTAGQGIWGLRDTYNSRANFLYIDYNNIPDMYDGKKIIYFYDGIKNF